MLILTTYVSVLAAFIQEQAFKVSCSAISEVKIPSSVCLIVVLKHVLNDRFRHPHYSSMNELFLNIFSSGVISPAPQLLIIFSWMSSF